MTKQISLHLFIISSFMLLLGVSMQVAQAADETRIDAAAQTYTTAIQTIQTARWDGELKQGNARVHATRVRSAFLQAKKAFHAARMDIQSIKKGDEDARQGVPSFFESENDEDDEDYEENEDEIVASN